MGHCMCLMGWGPVDLTHVALKGPCREMCFGICDEGPPGGRQEGRQETRWALCQRGQMQQLGSARRGDLRRSVRGLPRALRSTFIHSFITQSLLSADSGMGNPTPARHMGSLPSWLDRQ